MAYIGRQLARGENKLFDDISSSFNGSTTTFTLAVSSVATATATPYQLFVSLGGVMQKPNTDFTTAGNQITFTTAPAAGLSCWIMMQGDTIDNAAVADASITPSKISGSNFAFSGDLRLKDADGSHYVGFKSPTTVASNIVWTLPAADSSGSKFLKSNGSGVLSWDSPATVGGATGVDFNDNVKARWGTGNDLEVFHNGSNSVINDAGTGDLLLQVGGSTQATISSTGIVIANNLTVSGTTTTINTQTLDVEDKNVVIGKVSSPSDTTADGGGWTLKGSTDKTFNWVNATDAWTSSEHIHLLDGKKLNLGTDTDASLFHDGSNTYLTSTTGTIHIQGKSGENSIRAIPDGSVELYHNNVKKIETTSGGINVTGAISVGGSPLATSPTLDLVADGAIAANHTVVVTSAGKAKEATETITVSDPPTALSLTTTNGSVQQGRLGYDPVHDVTFLLMRDTSNDCNVEGYLWDNAASNLNNPGNITEIASSGVESMPSVASHPTNGYHFALWKSGHGNVTRGRMFNFNSSGVPSTGSDQDISASYTQATYANGRNVVYCPDDDKFVFLYWDSGTAYSKVLTPNYSGKSVSAGSAASVISDSDVDIFYDEYSNKLIACGWDGNYLEARIGTISGTSISWSSITNIAGDGSANNNGSWPSVCGEPETGKLLFVWMQLDSGGNYYGRCKVASVNGSTFTLGSEATFQGSITGGTSRNRVFYDPTLKRLIITYRAGTNTTQIKTVTITGTTPTFTNPVTIAGNGQDGVDMVYSPVLKRWAFTSNISTDFKNCTVFTGGATTNLTTENFIGFSSAAYSDGNTATINVVGNTTTQSSLTPGQTYYVDNAGDLSTTASTPSVVAGVAVTSTKLLIKPA